MDLEVEIDNRNAELAVYEAERPRMAPEQLAGWDAWGASVLRKKADLISQRAVPPAPVPDLPTVVITPVEDSTAYGVIHIGAEEDA